MNLLDGTPYLIHGNQASRIFDEAIHLEQEVSLLRRNGKLDTNTLEVLRREWGIRQVHESAAIEGNQLTLNETQIAIQRGITISGKPPEHSEEVQNLYNAHQYIETLAHSKTPLTELEIRELQSIIVGTKSKGAGVYRSVDVAISGSRHVPPHHLHVSQMMQDFSSWISTAESLVPLPLLVAVSHAWIVHIHPFSDGNGRTARAVTNLLLVRYGYPVIIIRKKDRQRYYEALQNSDDGDISGVLELFVERCQDSLHQIDRARTAATGISIALERVKAKEEREYRIWSDSLRLFVSTMDNSLREIETDPLYSVETQFYDVPSFEDYREICSASPSGNTWLMRCRITRGRVSHSWLFWVGFSSPELTSHLKCSHPIPSIKISVPNFTPPPAWVWADSTFPSPVIEFTYSAGQFHRLEKRHNLLTMRHYDSVVELTSEFVSELIAGWFV